MKRRSIIGILVLLSGMLVLRTGIAQPCVDWYRDADNDGFGNPADVNNSCTAVAGYVTNKLDCNDISANTPVWKRFGPGAFSSGAVVKTQMAVGSDGTPYVVYRNFTADLTVSSIGVKKFNGSAWVSLGADPISNSINMYNPSIAVDSQGGVYIAFLDFDEADDSNNKVTVMKYNTATNTWDVVGSRRFSVQTSLNAVINMAIDSNGLLYVAFSSAASGAVVMKYNGAAWQTLGLEDFAIVYNDEVAIAIDGIDRVYTAMIDDAVGGEASVMRFNGASWEYVGGAGFSDNYVENVPRISFDTANQPYALYYDASAELMVRRFDGTAWQDVGTSSVYSGYMASSLDMELDRFAKPYVVYIDVGTLELFVKTLDAGNNWIDAAGGSYSAMDLSIAIAPDNIPYVSFRDISNSERVAVLSVTPQASLPSAPAVSVSKSISCAAEPITLSIGGTSNLRDASQWVWYSGSCSGTPVGTGTSVAVAPNVTTTYYARAEGACLAAPGTCSNLSVTVNQRPAITAQPSAAPSVCHQGTTTLSVTPGTGFGYQWYRDNNDGTGFSALTGETGSTLTLATVTTAMNAYRFRVDVRNTATGCTSASTISTLTVNANPTIITQPVSTTTICEGSNTSFTVAETGGGAYQWELYSGGAWGPVMSETAATLAITNAAYALDNTQYRVTVSNTATTCKTVSTASTLRVNTAPAVNSPQSVTICSGEVALFPIAAFGTNLTYTWQEDRGAGFTPVGLGGMYNVDTQGNLIIGGPPETMSGYRYRVVVSNTGCTPATSNGLAVLVVNTAPAIHTQPTSSAICAAGSASFTAGATGTNLVYSWEEDRGSGFAAVSNGGVYSIDGNGTLTVAPAAVAMTGYRYRVVLSNAGCTATTSNGVATLTVNTAPAITADPQNTTACVNNTATFQATASGTNLNYQWQRQIGGAGWNDITGEIQTNLQVAAVTSGQNGYEYRLIAANTGCNAAVSSPALLTVNIQPVITNNPVDAVACVGSDATFEVMTNPTGLTYQWQVNDGTGWMDLGASSASSMLTLTSTTASLNTNQYRVTASNPGCVPVTSAAAVLSVNSASGIVTQPMDVTTCELGNASFGVSAVGANLTYQWQINDGSGWVDMPGKNQAAIALSGITTAQHANEFRARISTDACPDITSAAAMLRVNRKPQITLQPVNVAVCAGSDARFPAVVAGSELALQWQVNDGAGWKDMDAQTDADLLLAAVTPELQGYAYRLVATTPSCEPAVSSIAILTVNTDPGEGCGSLPLLISQGVSPNGDDKLDYWLIQGIEEYPNNQVKLYNIWGDLIFERNNYNNEANAWRGEANRGATLGGQRAPDGTYYYLIDLGNNSQALRGFVVLKR